MDLRMPHNFAGTARFELLGRLGQGGMGTVYEARDRERGIHVALKVLSASAMNAERLLLFKKEFRALQDLQHPNLVQLGELFEEDGQWFFTMELVEGVDFLTYVRPPAASSVESELPTSELDPSTMGGSTLETPSTAAPAATSARHDEARLRSALIQLTHALSALHRAKKVHRDLKPSKMSPPRNMLPDSPRHRQRKGTSTPAGSRRVRENY